jgi:hypothetical protein
MDNVDHEAWKGAQESMDDDAGPQVPEERIASAAHEGEDSIIQDNGRFREIDDDETPVTNRSIFVVGSVALHRDQGTGWSILDRSYLSE